MKRYAEHLLGQPLDAPRSQKVVARATVRRNQEGNWELTLRLAVDERIAKERLVAKRCEALADATGFKVAMATDPEVAMARQAQAAPPDLATTAAEPEPPELKAPAAAPPPPAAPPGFKLGLRADAGADLQTLSTTAPGAALTVFAERTFLRAELSARGHFFGEARDQRVPEVGARLQLLSGASRLCAVIRTGSLSLPLCLGAEFGLMRGVGFGAQENQTDSSLWGAALLGLAGSWPITDRVSLWVGSEAVAPFLRPGFNVRNLGTLYTAPRASLRFAAGAEIRLGR
ncbi:MAG TPA: hypothetical protein VGF45_19165 [Polyangia bacterium]